MSKLEDLYKIDTNKWSNIPTCLSYSMNLVLSEIIQLSSSFRIVSENNSNFLWQANKTNKELQDGFTLFKETIASDIQELQLDTKSLSSKILDNQLAFSRFSSDFEKKHNELSNKVNNFEEILSPTIDEFQTYQKKRKDQDDKIAGNINQKIIDTKLHLKKSIENIPEVARKAIDEFFKSLNAIKQMKYNNVIEFINDFELKMSKIARDVNGTFGVMDKCKDIDLELAKIKEKSIQDLDKIKLEEKVQNDKLRLEIKDNRTRIDMLKIDFENFTEETKQNHSYLGENIENKYIKLNTSMSASNVEFTKNVSGVSKIVESKTSQLQNQIDVSVNLIKDNNNKFSTMINKLQDKIEDIEKNMNENKQFNITVETDDKVKKTKTNKIYRRPSTQFVNVNLDKYKEKNTIKRNNSDNESQNSDRSHHSKISKSNVNNKSRRNSMNLLALNEINKSKSSFDKHKYKNELNHNHSKSRVKVTTQVDELNPELMDQLQQLQNAHSNSFMLSDEDIIKKIRNSDLCVEEFKNYKEDKELISSSLKSHSDKIDDVFKSIKDVEESIKEMKEMVKIEHTKLRMSITDVKNSNSKMKMIANSNSNTESNKNSSTPNSNQLNQFKNVLAANQPTKEEMLSTLENVSNKKVESVAKSIIDQFAIVKKLSEKIELITSSIKLLRNQNDINELDFSLEHQKRARNETSPYDDKKSKDRIKTEVSESQTQNHSAYSIHNSQIYTKSHPKRLFSPELQTRQNRVTEYNRLVRDIKLKEKSEVGNTTQDLIPELGKLRMESKFFNDTQERKIQENRKSSPKLKKVTKILLETTKAETLKFDEFKQNNIDLE